MKQRNVGDAANATNSTGYFLLQQQGVEHEPDSPSPRRPGGGRWVSSDSSESTDARKRRAKSCCKWGCCVVLTTVLCGIVLLGALLLYLQIRREAFLDDEEQRSLPTCTVERQDRLVSLGDRLARAVHFNVNRRNATLSNLLPFKVSINFLLMDAPGSPSFWVVMLNVSWMQEMVAFIISQDPISTSTQTIVRNMVDGDDGRKVKIFRKQLPAFGAVIFHYRPEFLIEPFGRGIRLRYDQFLAPLENGTFTLLPSGPPTEPIWKAREIKGEALFIGLRLLTHDDIPFARCSDA